MMSEVTKYMALGEMVKRSRKGGGAFVSLSDYDAQRDEGLAREAELKRQLKETRIPQEIAAELERTDWTPEQALKWYAEGKHFDVVAGRSRIIDTGHVASNALKHLSAEYLEHKGDAQLHELQQRLAEAERLLRKVDMRPADNTAEVPHGWWEKRAELLLSLPTTTGCADGEKAEYPAPGKCAEGDPS